METKTGKKKDRIVPGIFSLTNRAIVFFSCLLAVIFVFYITGSFDNFLDNNLLLILLIEQIISVISIVFCFASIAQSVFFAIIYRDLHYLIPIIPVVLANFFAVFCFIISGTITVVSKGTV